MSAGPDMDKLIQLVATIAHSSILPPRPARRVGPLPCGFDAADVAVLEWIAAEARRSRRNIVRI